MPLVDLSSSESLCSDLDGVNSDDGSEPLRHRRDDSDSGHDEGGGALEDSSSSSSASDRQQTESESESNSSDSSASTDPAEEQRLRVQRQARTMKARLASLVSRARKKLVANTTEITMSEHPAEAFKPCVKHGPDNPLNQTGLTHRSTRFRRLRLLVSFLRAWSVRLMSFLNFASSGEMAVHHTIQSTIIDDCNLRLGTTAGESSRVTSVMNAVQSFTVCYGPAAAETWQMSGSSLCRKTFCVYTPLVVLPKSDKDTICAELLSRLLLFLGHVSERFQAFGVSSTFPSTVKIQGMTLCFDSLVTNLAVAKQMRVLLHEGHENLGYESIHPVMITVCMIHQVALARKCLLNGFAGYYSSVVRLAHLFEISNFRQQFRQAMLAVIYHNFSYVPVAALPPLSGTWHEQRKEILGVLEDGSSRVQKRRQKLHMQLAAFDNGCPSQPAFTHYCVGSCCPGSSHKLKSRYALIQMCKLYTKLFSFGYPVPLTYRWIHAARALEYVKELWHQNQNMSLESMNHYVQ